MPDLLATFKARPKHGRCIWCYLDYRGHFLQGTSTAEFAHPFEPANWNDILVYWADRFAA